MKKVLVAVCLLAVSFSLFASYDPFAHDPVEASKKVTPEKVDKKVAQVGIYSFLGTALGGVIGFCVGGPAGAAVGAGIGGSAGVGAGVVRICFK